MHRPTRVIVLESGAGFGGSVVGLAKLVKYLPAEACEVLPVMLHMDSASADFFASEEVRSPT
jgi:hypothetical protein